MKLAIIATLLSQVVVVQPNGGTVSGTVLDEHSRAVPGATVYLLPQNTDGEIDFGLVGALLGDPELPEDTLRAESSATGRFEITGVDPTQSYLLAVDHPSFVHLTRRQVTAGDGETVDVGELVLERGLSLRGMVRGADGAGIPGARVTVALAGPCAAAPEGVRRIPHRMVLTDEDGTFVAEGLWPCEYSISAAAAGHLAADEVVQSTPSEGELDSIEIVLDRGRRLTGVVRGPKGTPLAGVTVRLREMKEVNGRFSDPGLVFDSDTFDIFGPREEVTADDGSFAFSKIASARVKVIASPEELAQTAVEVDTTEDAEVEIQVGRAGSLQGRVVDATTGEPITRYTLRLEPVIVPGHRDLSRRRREVNVESGDGTFEISGLDPGAFSVQAKARHHRFVPGPEVDVASGPNELGEPLSLPALGRVTGRVVDENGAAVAGAEVRLRLGPEESFQEQIRRVLEQGDSVPELTAQTDDEGRFELDAVDAGPLQLTASRAGFSPATVGGIDLAPGQTREAVVLTLARAGALEGVIRLNGQPAPGVLVELNGPLDRGAQALSVDSGAAGRFRFDTLRPGEYVAFVGAGWVGFDQDAWFTSTEDDFTGESFQARPVRVTVEAGEVAPCELSWEPPRASGRVQAAGTGVPNAMVFVANSETGRILAEMSTDERGRFASGEIEGGEILIYALMPGAPYALVASETTRIQEPAEVELTFPEASLEIHIETEAEAKSESAPEHAQVHLEVLAFGEVPEGEHDWILLGDREEPPFPFRPREAPEGKTRFDHLLPGTYRIRVEAEGHAPSEQTIEVKDKGQRITLRLEKLE